jgi:transaldolase
VTTLRELYESGGQSPWLDNVRRDWLRDGTMARIVGEGVRGVTSNPTIFAKALEATDEYDAQVARLSDETPDDAFVELASRDIADVAELLAPTFADSGGADGLVSFEVPPTLAHDTDATVAAGRSISKRFALPNLLVKVPATAAGLPAITALLADGVSVNVTLIFGLERYLEVIDAFLAGLEQAAAAGRALRSISSVASFFVSRVDTEVDARLDALGAPAELRGRAAVAQAQVAYARFTERFAAPRFRALADQGARVQRPLWASTSTKNPAYDDLLYVDTLIGPDTVNTMPDATIEAFRDHGTVARTIDADPDAARRTLEAVEAAGVSMQDVAATLEDKGVASFADSYADLLATIASKRGGATPATA